MGLNNRFEDSYKAQPEWHWLEVPGVLQSSHSQFHDIFFLWMWMWRPAQVPISTSGMLLRLSDNLGLHFSVLIDMILYFETHACRFWKQTRSLGFELRTSYIRTRHHWEYILQSPPVKKTVQKHRSALDVMNSAFGHRPRTLQLQCETKRTMSSSSKETLNHRNQVWWCLTKASFTSYCFFAFWLFGQFSFRNSGLDKWLS